MVVRCGRWKIFYNLMFESQSLVYDIDSVSPVVVCVPPLGNAEGWSGRNTPPPDKMVLVKPFP